MRSIVLAIAILAAAPAHAFMAENDLVVRAQGPDAFNVPYRGKSGASHFWCAAGDYVIRELNLPPDTPIYRTSSPPRRAGQGVSFNITGENAKRTGLLLLSGGRYVSASFARALCDEPIIRE